MPIDIHYTLIALLTVEQAHTLQAIPYKAGKNTLFFYVADGKEVDADMLEFLLGKRPVFTKLPPAEFERTLFQYYPQQQQNVGPIRQKSDSDVVSFVDQLFEGAVSIKASDIHIERYETYARVRFRWEGQLLEKFEVPLDKYNAVISRIKIMSELDIAERRLPQDGRINLKLQGQQIDVRVSIIPSKFGKKP